AEGSRAAPAVPGIEAGHLGRVNGLALSPDGRTMAIASRAAAVVLWDAKEDRLLHLLPGHAGPVRAVAFDAAGTLVASASDDGASRVWDVTTGQQLYQFEWVPEVRSVAFTLDSANLLTGGEDGLVRVWKLGGGEVAQILAHDGAVDAMTIADVDGTALLATGGADGTVKLWSLAQPHQPLVTLPVPDGVRALALFSSPLPGARGVTVAAGGDGAKVYVWTLPLDGKPAPRPRVLAHPGGLLALAFDAAGEQLASGGWDKKVRIWQLAGAKLLREMAPADTQADEITGLAYDAKGDLLAAARLGGVALWDTDVGDKLRVLGAAVPEVRTGVVSGDGGTLVTATSSGHLVVWHPSAREPVQVIDAGGKWLWDVDLSPDGSRLAAASEDGTVTIYTLPDGKRGPVIQAPKEPYAAAFSPDGKRLAIGGGFETLGLWDAASGAPIAELAPAATEGAVEELAWVDDTRLLVSMSSNRVRLWDTATRTAVRSHGLSQKGYILPLAISRDRSRFAAGAENGSLGVWDLATGKRLLEIPAHGGPVRGLAFSRDGKQLASVGVDQSLKIWDLPGGAPAAALAAYTGEGRFVDYSADGKAIWSGDSSGVIRLDRAGAAPARLLSLYAAPGRGWLAIGAGGEVDDDPAGLGRHSLTWQVGDVRLPGEVAWKRAHVPGLLTRRPP
ncbi:MAG TPA: WD40 repeat domain-containing protein, partial [Kofleriaceae bacterium]|nr:WD40 repeat domain-containing protein [Kofleriaceae bacterium]